MMDIVIGIDIGGSMVRMGAIDMQSELLALRESPIEARRGPQEGLERIAGLIEELLHDENVEGTTKTISLRGIGIGCTGPVDLVQGVVNNPYTLPTWENVPLRTWLEERFGVPATLENDADMAALGEYWKGAGKGVDGFMQLR
jgi:glucokinase